MDVGGCLDAGDFTKGTGSVSGVQDLCKEKRRREEEEEEEKKKKQWCNNESKLVYIFFLIST